MSGSADAREPSLLQVERVAQKLRADIIAENNLRRGGPGRSGCLETLLTETLRVVYGERDGVPTAAPFALRDVPTLADVADKQLRLASKVMSAVATRPVVTVFELEEEICVGEGVAAFADLGFGRHLQGLPIVQQYFQVAADRDVLPVTSAQVVAFLLNEMEGRREGGVLQDTRSLMNAFRGYYERECLTEEGSSARRKGIAYNRELGVHIQSLPWLLLSLRQTAAATARTAAIASVVEEAKTVFQRNRSLYTEVVRALDQKLLTSTAAGPFTVDMPERAARRTSVPLALWENAEGRRGDGGVSLPLYMGAVTSHSPCAPPPPPPPVAAASTIGGASALPPATPPPPPVPPAAAVTRRRRGGSIHGGVVAVSDGGAAVSVASAVVPAPVPASLTPSLLPPSSQIVAHSPPSQMVEDEEGVPAALVASALERLHGYVDETEKKRTLSPSALVSTALSQLPIGQCVSTTLLRKVFDKLARELGEQGDEGRRELSVLLLSSAAFLPILRASPQHSKRTNVDDHDGDDVRDVIALVRVGDVCWDEAVGDGSSVETEEEEERKIAAERLLPTVVAAGGLPYLPSSARGLFRTLSTPPDEPKDIVAPWLRSMEIVKRVTDMSAVRDVAAFTTQHLRALAFYFELVFSHFADDVSRFVQCVEALAERHELPLRYVFPCQGIWCRSADTLYFGGPHFYGYTDLRLRPRRVGAGSSSPATEAMGLAVLRCEADEPSFVVHLVLRAFGLRSLESAVQRRVSFQSLRHSDTALLLHKAVGTMVPLVHCFLAHADPQLHRLSHATLAERLATFQVILGKEARLTETLVRSGLQPLTKSDRCYTCSCSVRLTYVAQHNTLYGEDADCSHAVVAEALLDFFTPMKPLHRRVNVFPRLQRLLVRLLAVFFSFVETANSGRDSAPVFHQGEHTFTQRLLLSQGMSPEEQQLRRALAEEAQRFALAESLPYPIEPSFSCPVLPPFSVAPPPPLKRQMHFPPGCDGMGLPAVRDGSRRPPMSTPSSTHTGPPQPVLGGGRPMSDREVTRAARGLPQWQGEFWQSEANDALSSALRLLVTREDTAAPDDGEGEDPGEGNRERRGRRPPPPRPIAEEDGARKRARPTDTLGDGSGDVGDGFLAMRTRTFVSADGSSTANDTTAAATAAERFVYEHLKLLVEERNAEEAARRTGLHYRVVWLNEASERGTAYDLLILCTKGGGESGTEVSEYIEVKSTTSGDRKDFELSLRELLLAARYGSAYKVYRVFGASTSPMRRMKFRVYEDLLRLWYMGKLTLVGNVHATPAF